MRARKIARVATSVWRRSTRCIGIDARSCVPETREPTAVERQIKRSASVALAVLDAQLREQIWVRRARYRRTIAQKLTRARAQDGRQPHVADLSAGGLKGAPADIKGPAVAPDGNPIELIV